MNISHTIGLGLASILVLSLIGCGGETTIEVSRVVDPVKGPTTSYKIVQKITYMWVGPGQPPEMSQEIVFQDYPYNRIILRCSSTSYDTGQPIVTPINLPSGQHYTVNVSIGSWSKSYDTVTASLSTLPAGETLLDCPGMMQDIVLAARDNPSGSININISSSLFLEAPLTIMISPEQSVPLQQVQVEPPERPTHPPIQTKY